MFFIYNTSYTFKKSQKGYNFFIDGLNTYQEMFNTEEYQLFNKFLRVSLPIFWD